MSQKSVLRVKQREVLADMIKQAVPLSSSTFGGDDERNELSAVSWKLLIFDNVGRSIIAPLLKVKDLREMGVTLHMMIDKPREAVPGAPAIYFCAPTEQNIARIAQDCVNELYQWVYVNFTAQIQRKLLEQFAELLSAGGKLQSIRHIKVVDRTLSYVALSNDLFSLMLPGTLRTLNSRHTQDAQMDECLQKMVLGITHVVLTMQTLPVVAYAKSGASEELAKRVTQSINDALQERTLSPSAAGGLGRPLLLIVDRCNDLASALHHPFSYRGLLIDAMGMTLNKVDVMSDGKEKTFEIDPEGDAFFKQNCGVDFGSIAPNVEAALGEYKRDVAQLGAENSSSGDHHASDGNDAAAMSKMLANAPKLAEKKRSIDAHMTLAYSILRKIKEHELDGFHGVELGVMSREGIDQEHFKKLMESGCALNHKQRLFLIAYLLAESEDDIQEIEAALPHLAPPSTQQSAAGTPTAQSSGMFPALQYIRHLRSWSLGGQQLGGPSSTASSASSLGWGFAQSIAKNIAATLKGSSETELPLTRLVDAAMQDTSAINVSSGSRSAAQVRNKLLESVAALDPRTKQPIDISESRFQQAVVFVVGGGNVNEVDDLKRWEAKHSRKSVIYGCTELCTGDSILKELSELGSE